MPFYLSLANFANGLIWAVYALLKFDINVLVNSQNLLSLHYRPWFLSESHTESGIYPVLQSHLFIFFSKKVPNGLGAISGLVQLILYAAYHKSTDWDEEPEKPAANVELSSTNNRA